MNSPGFGHLLQLSGKKGHGRGSAVAIGNFDGVHRGHRLLLGRVVAAAQERELLATAVTFEPLPREWFADDRQSAPPRLTSMREKLVLLREIGIDRVLILHFNGALNQMSPEDFCRSVLQDLLQTRFVAAGQDFRFGCQRQGDLPQLRQIGAELGFEVEPVPPALADKGGKISSTLIRSTLADGDLPAAAHMLARPYWIEGRVFRGDGYGRQLGYATANIAIGSRKLPIAGVFAASAELVGGSGDRPAGEMAADIKVPGMANIGTRPTLGGHELRAEIHLFDIDQDLYNQKLRLHFWQRLRDERRFASPGELKAAISKDEDCARDYFHKNSRPRPPL